MQGGAYPCRRTAFSPSWKLPRCLSTATKDQNTCLNVPKHKPSNLQVVFHAVMVLSNAIEALLPLHGARLVAQLESNPFQSSGSTKSRKTLKARWRSVETEVCSLVQSNHHFTMSQGLIASSTSGWARCRAASTKQAPAVTIVAAGIRGKTGNCVLSRS